MAIGTIPISEEAVDFATHLREAYGLWVVATPSLTDRFQSRCFDQDFVEWRRLEHGFPVIPQIWWYNLPQNRPIANALDWAVQMQFVQEGPVSKGHLLIRTLDGRISLRCRSIGSPFYFKNLETHIAYLRSQGA